MSEWIRTKDRIPPSMDTVILYVGGKVMVGWNEAVQPEEDPIYTSWEEWPESTLDGEGVTHWMALPDPPND
jgi:Protein of unknown function (DUF551)